MNKVERLITQLCPDGVPSYPLQKVFSIRNGYTPSKSNSKFWTDGTVPWFRMEDIQKNGRLLKSAIQYVHESALKGAGLFEAYSIIMSTSATIGEHAMIEVPFLANQRFTVLTRNREFIELLRPKFAYYLMFGLAEFCKENTTMSNFAGVEMAKFRAYMMQIPPIQVQDEIVRILDIFTELEAELEAELETRKTQYLHYSESALFNEIDEGLSRVKLGDICDLQNGYAFKSQDMKNAEAVGLMPILRISNLDSGGGIVGDFKFHSPDGIGDRFIVSENDVVIAMTGATLGKVAVIQKGRFLLNQRVGMFRNDKTKIDIKYLSFMLRSRIFYNYCQNTIGFSAQGNISKDQILDFEFSLPSLQIQEKITDFLGKFESLVLGANSLIPIEILARRQQYEFYRNKLLAFKELEVT